MDKMPLNILPDMLTILPAYCLDDDNNDDPFY